MRRLGVHPGVVDEQQHAAGRNRGEQRMLGRGVGGAQQSGILRGDEVERPQRVPRLRQLGMHPANGHAGVARVPDGPPQRHARDLERGDIPAAAREPDGVRALATADVEHPSGREPGDLGNQRTVGLTAPQQLSLGVPPVPFRRHRGVSDVSVGRREGEGRGRSRRDVVGHRAIVAYRTPVLPALFAMRHNATLGSEYLSEPRRGAGPPRRLSWRQF